MQLHFEQLDGQAVLIRLGHVLDTHNAEAFKAACRLMLEASVDRYVVECSACRQIDSVGLDVLFWLYQWVSAGRGKVVLSAQETPARALCSRLRLDGTFEVYASVAEAHRALGTCVAD